MEPPVADLLVRQTFTVIREQEATRIVSLSCRQRVPHIGSSNSRTDPTATQWMSPNYYSKRSSSLLICCTRQPVEKGTGPICAKHSSGRSGELDVSPFFKPRTDAESDRFLNGLPSATVPPRFISNDDLMRPACVQKHGGVRQDSPGDRRPAACSGRQKDGLRRKALLELTVGCPADHHGERHHRGQNER